MRFLRNPFERLKALLDDEQALATLLSGPRDAVTESQREALTSLAQYYVGSGMEGDGKEESDGGDEERGGVVQEDSDASKNRDDRDCSQHRLLSKVAHGDTRARTRATPPGTRTANGTDNDIDGERPRKRQRNSLSQGRSGLKPDRNNGNGEERSNAVAGSTPEDTSGGARSGTPNAHVNTVARSSQTRHPWKSVLRLTSLSLDPALQQHLTKYGPDPAKFLNDDGLLKYHVTDSSRESRSDAFIACYRYTEGLETRLVNDRVRWCFAMLMYYDLFQIITPGRGRIGHLMLSDVLTHFGKILGPSTVTPEKALKQVNGWLLRGKKMNHLCKQFGPGCLFFLGDVLSSDFLTHKFTYTGTYSDAAKHLTQLRLKEEAIRVGAVELGRRVRELLIQPFKQVKE